MERWTTLEAAGIVGFDWEVFPNDDYARAAAARVASGLPRHGPVVLTGGSTAEKVYPQLARARGDWSDLGVYWSDERCVPPTHDASNYGMAKRLLLDEVHAGDVHRMEGEAEPEEAAERYDKEIRDAAVARLDLVLLGMGADCHICALFPGSPALDEPEALCVPVERPDGLKGLTLTPPAVQRSQRVLLLVAGESKAEAVRRAVRSNDDLHDAPVRLLADHPDAVFLLDEAAASLL